MENTVLNFAQTNLDRNEKLNLLKANKTESKNFFNEKIKLGKVDEASFMKALSDVSEIYFTCGGQMDEIINDLIENNFNDEDENEKYNKYDMTRNEEVRALKLLKLIVAENDVFIKGLV